MRRRFGAAEICKGRLNGLIIGMPDRIQKPQPPVPAPSGGGGGDAPRSPQVEKPNTEELLKRMRKVDPDQARRYRQRTGQ